MKWSFFALLTVLASLAFTQDAMPRMTTVEPGNGKAGDELTIAGENLAAKLVHDRVVRWAAGRKNFVPQLIGLHGLQPAQPAIAAAPKVAAKLDSALPAYFRFKRFLDLFATVTISASSGRRSPSTSMERW